jgi:putative oxidoreductase
MTNASKLLLRLMVGGLLLFHGIFKLKYGVGFVETILHAHHLPKILAYGVYLSEIVGAIFLIIGWKSRVWGLVIAFEMVMAIYLTKLHLIFKLGSNGALVIERELLFLIGAIVISLVGSGRYAIDRDG